jgi:pimeloyl-ACP methyl ester carboxylesterase
MEGFFAFKGGRIYYSDSGKGRVIILLHGYLESSEVWNGFAQKLSDKFRVISVDLPGHGFSDVYGETHSMEFMAEGLNVLTEKLEIDKIFLVGHSLGGYVAMAFLELYPEKLTAYCLFHSHPFADTQMALEKREREIRIVKAGRKNIMYPENVTKMFADSNIEKFHEALERSKDIASRLPDNGIISMLNGMMIRPSRLSLMEAGKVPCLWILGSMDNYISCEQVQKNVRLPGNAKVVILERSGHLGFIEEEDRSVKVITEFMVNLKHTSD